MGADARAWCRREMVERARANHRRALARGDSPYPTALVLAQRVGVALEDLARLTIALRTLYSDDDAFEALRDARLEDMTDTFARLAEEPEELQAALRLPTAEATADLPDDQRDALLMISDRVAMTWHGQWVRAALGWQLLHKLAKAMRHGSPLVPREVVREHPGAGLLGEGLADFFERWVLVVDTTVDHVAREHRTEYAAADLTDETLVRGRQGGLDAISLTRAVASAHVYRVQTESKWAIPRDALRLVPPDVRRTLRETRSD